MSTHAGSVYEGIQKYIQLAEVRNLERCPSG
jgi:hypothetical protein